MTNQPPPPPEEGSETEPETQPPAADEVNAVEMTATALANELQATADARAAEVAALAAEQAAIEAPIREELKNYEAGLREIEEKHGLEHARWQVRENLKQQDRHPRGRLPRWWIPKRYRP